MGGRTDTNFDILRVFAASLVVYGNGWILSGGLGPGLWGAPFARVGLDLFFSISGYLVAGSWARHPNWRAFVVRRVVRPFPGLITAVFATVLIIGPLATTLSLRFYFLNGMTLKYFANLYLHPELFLPNVFAGRQWNGAVNPMLWTIKLGLLCCMALPFFARLPRGLGIPAMAAAGIVSGAGYLALIALYPRVQLSFLYMNIRDVSVELPFFFFASLFGLLAPRIVAIWRCDLAMLLFAANWASAAWIGEWNVVLEWLSLPYMAICFGRMATPGMEPLIRRVGNPAYGIYLYAFPIQQLVLARLPDDPHPIVTCAVLTLSVAILSWHIVERPALQWLQHRGPPWLRPVR